MIYSIWAASWQNQQNGMCTQWRLRSASASRSVRVAERLALPTSDHGVAGSNPAGGEILPEPKRRFIAQSLSCSPFHPLEMTEILLKGRKTLSHPSIQASASVQSDQSSLFAWIKLGSLATHWVLSEDSDQTGQMPKLNWVFAGRTGHFVGFVMRRLILLCHCNRWWLQCESRVPRLWVWWWNTWRASQSEEWPPFFSSCLNNNSGRSDMEDCSAWNTCLLLGGWVLFVCFVV